MDLSVRSRNGAVPDNLRRYAEKKVQKLTKYFRSVQSAELEQAIERGQHVIELNVAGDGIVLRSEDRANDMLAAVDSVINKMERQVKRYKTRLRDAHQRPGTLKTKAGTVREAEVVVLDEDESSTPQIIRRKRFSMKPMSAEEAAQQMELVGHDFYLFRNELSGVMNLLYRRRDGHFGLIEPEA
jgi:putative sigma-54 modulation protein